ncbi:MAG TPA: hypothetical protein VL134_09245 [Leptolyngbya sp.]|jgi:hypothetical protein|nr:hypothetical protein [Leptolyngbya sp.]
MKFSPTEGQNDFLEVLALQKLIIAAMKASTEKYPHELRGLLKQVQNRHNAASSYVQSEVAELMQELRNLVGAFETEPSADPAATHPVSYPPTRSNSKFSAMGFAWVGIAAIVALSSIGFESVRHAIAPVFSSETGCTEVNPKRVNVQGYDRDNGTSVAPYERTAPNHTTSDNLNCSR